jgi:Uma2 family endonuclease
MLTVTRRHFTLEEYHRLGELGFFGEEEQVELIRGEIIQMPTKKPPHSVCNTLLWQELYKLIEGRAILRVQEPIILPTDSEPQPDIAIVCNQEDNYLSSHPYPEDILLIIEVVDSPLKYDQETKLRLYAEASISDYWIVNLVDNQLETYSQPYQEHNGQFNYRLKRIYLSNEYVKIPCFSELSLALSSILLSATNLRRDNERGKGVRSQENSGIKSG